MAKISDRYAIALFKISEEKASLEEDLEQAILIRDSLRNKDVQAFLLHPSISNSAKKQIFKNTFSDKASKHMIGFLNLMVNKNRESSIVSALTKYIELVDRYFGRIEARVVSAKPLTEEQNETISNILLKKTDMQIKINTAIDPDVMGGFYILVEGSIFDSTVRTRINRLKERFYKGIVIARVVSAKPLTEEQKETISKLVSKKLNTEVKVNVVIDKDLLGGFYVVVDGHVYDGTIRAKLQDEKKSLKRGKFEW